MGANTTKEMKELQANSRGKLDLLRSFTGISQESFAEEMKVDPITVRRWNKDSGIPFDRFNDVANFFNRELGISLQRSDLYKAENHKEFIFSLGVLSLKNELLPRLEVLETQLLSSHGEKLDNIYKKISSIEGMVKSENQLNLLKIETELKELKLGLNSLIDGCSDNNKNLKKTLYSIQDTIQKELDTLGKLDSFGKAVDKTKGDLHLDTSILEKIIKFLSINPYYSVLAILLAAIISTLIIVDNNKEVVLCEEQTNEIRSKCNGISSENFSQLLDSTQEICREAISEDYTNPQNYLNLGHLYECQGNLDLALKSVLKATERSPNNIDSQAFAARIYKEKGDNKNAKEYYTNAIKLQKELPNENPEFYYERGKLYEVDGSLEAALTDYDYAISLNGKIRDYHLTKAELLLRSGNIVEEEDIKEGKIKEAIKTFERYQNLLSRNEITASFLLKLSELHLSVMQNKSAKIKFDEAKKIGFTTAKDLMQAGKITYKAVAINDGLRYFLDVIEMEKELDFNERMLSPDDHIDIAVHFTVSNYFHQSNEILEAIIKEFSTQESISIVGRAKTLMGINYYFLDEQQTAINVFETASHILKDSFNANSYLGSLYFRTGNISSAKSAVDAALWQHDENADMYYFRGMYYAEQAEYDSARNALFRALELVDVPHMHLVTRENILFAISNTYTQEGNYDKVIEYLSLVLATQPRNVPALSMRSLIYIQKDDFENARRDFEQALELDSRYVPAYLSRIFYHLHTVTPETTRSDIEKKAEQILSDVKIVLEIEPDNVFGYTSKGRAFVGLYFAENNKNRLNQAIAAFKDAIKKGYESSKIDALVATSYYELGDLKNSCEYYSKICEGDSCNPFPKKTPYTKVVNYCSGNTL